MLKNYVTATAWHSGIHCVCFCKLCFRLNDEFDGNMTWKVKMYHNFSEIENNQQTSVPLRIDLLAALTMWCTVFDSKLDSIPQLPTVSYSMLLVSRLGGYGECHSWFWWTKRNRNAIKKKASYWQRLLRLVLTDHNKPMLSEWRLNRNAMQTGYVYSMIAVQYQNIFVKQTEKCSVTQLNSISQIYWWTFDLRYLVEIVDRLITTFRLKVSIAILSIVS